MRNLLVLLTLLLLSVPPAALAQTPGPSPQTGPGLATPRDALSTFLTAAATRDFQSAAAVLDLGGLPADQRALLGPMLAQQLHWLLVEKLQLDLEPERLPAAPKDARVSVAVVPLDGEPVQLRLVREGDAWRFSREAVASIPALYAAYGTAPVSRHLPSFLSDVSFLGVMLWQWLFLLASYPAAYLVGWLLATLVVQVVTRITRRTGVTWDDRLGDTVRLPLRFLLALFALQLLVHVIHLPAAAQAFVDGIDHSIFISALAWLCVNLILFAASTSEAYFAVSIVDVARSRSLRTQISLVRRIAIVAVLLFAGALILMQFEVVRTVGVSLLASAGVATVVVGLAAQKSLGALLAGIQLSITQPARIGDTVIVEGEWGWIEEITLTYVVVRVWDLRRLVVPITRFLDTPFQNWTKVASNIMGTVEIPADFTVPVAKVREALSEFVASHPKWDGKTCGLQVTAASERHVTLRALVSSEDASKNWDLRCDVREWAIGYLQNLEGGRHLPRVRLEE